MATPTSLVGWMVWGLFGPGVRVGHGSSSYTSKVFALSINKRTILVVVVVVVVEEEVVED